MRKPSPTNMIAATLVCLAGGMASAGDSALAGDWPQFRGPAGQGTSDAAELPERWGGFDTPAWATNLPGRGWSSPVVVGERVWLTAAEATALPNVERAEKLDQGLYRGFPEQFQAHSAVTLLALEVNLHSGELLRTIDSMTVKDPPPIHGTNTYASPTPVADGRRLYCHFGSLGTVALDLTSGKVLWQTRLAVDEVTGPGGSPVLAGGRLVLACDGADAQFVVGLDHDSGKEVWRTPRPPIVATDPRHRRAFSTPLMLEHAGQMQVVVPGAQWVCAYDPADGRELWRLNCGAGQHATIPRPVSHNGLVFVCTGYPKPKLLAVRLGGGGDLTQTQVAWTYDRQVPEVSSPVVAKGRLYFVSAMGVATCLDAETGKLYWHERLGGNFSASPLAAAGNIYFTNEEGTTTVIPALRSLEILAQNELFGQTKASLAVADNCLLVRTDAVLYCIGSPAQR